MSGTPRPAGGLAVMAARREPPDSLDFFPTPPWGTRALQHRVLPAVAPLLPPLRSALDPCCGEGHMGEVLRETVPDVRAGDVFDYGRGYRIADFLDARAPMPQVDLVAMNPPFNAALGFVQRALTLAPVVAVLVRAAWLEGEGRYAALLRDRPPTLYAPFVERLAMVKGRWDPNASTATGYAWLLWIDGAPRQPLFLIPPGCKAALTRPDDVARFAPPAPLPLFEGNP